MGLYFKVDLLEVGYPYHSEPGDQFPQANSIKLRACLCLTTSIDTILVSLLQPTTLSLFFVSPDHVQTRLKANVFLSMFGHGWIKASASPIRSPSRCDQIAKWVTEEQLQQFYALFCVFAPLFLVSWSRYRRG